MALCVGLGWSFRFELTLGEQIMCVTCRNRSGVLFSNIWGEFGFTVNDAGFLHSPRSASVTRTWMKFCTSSYIFLSLNFRSFRTINRPHILRSSSSSSARIDANMTEGVGEVMGGGLMMIRV